MDLEQRKKFQIKKIKAWQPYSGIVPRSEHLITILFTEKGLLYKQDCQNNKTHWIGGPIKVRMRKKVYSFCLFKNMIKNLYIF